MNITLLLFSFVLLLILHYLWKRWQVIQRLPPGPWSLPIVGRIFEHAKEKNLHKVFGDYAKKYGKIFSLSYGNFNVVVVSDFRMIMDILKREEFSGRPKFATWKYRNMGVRNRGILFSDGKVWSEQRRFALRSLRDFGFGKKSMEQMIVSEAQEMVKYIDKDLSPNGSKVNMEYLFNCGVLNSLWTIVTGKRFEFGDPKFERLMKLFVSSLPPSAANPFQFFPIIIKLFPSKWKQVFQFAKEVHELVSVEIQEHISNFNSDQPRDFIDLYLQEMEKREGEETSSFYQDGMENLASVLLDLFVAGVETSSSTLRWCVIFLCQNPRIQKKLQDEIDRIIGKNRAPSRDDKPKMVYTEAFFSEATRRSTLVPFSVFHRVIRDTEFEGFLLPKDTVIFPYLDAIHQDKSHWGDPEVFRPERFLDESGTKFVKDDHLIPFSQGKRICIGEPLARDTIFLFLTTLLQKYNFSFDPKSPVIGIKSKAMAINPPDPYQVIVTPRD